MSRQVCRQLFEDKSATSAPLQIITAARLAATYGLALHARQRRTLHKLSTDVVKPLRDLFIFMVLLLSSFKRQIQLMQQFFKVVIVRLITTETVTMHAGRKCLKAKKYDYCNICIIITQKKTITTTIFGPFWQMFTTKMSNATQRIKIVEL